MDEIEGLIAVLSEGPSGSRCSAATALGRSRDPRAVAPLVAALAAKDALVFGSACAGLILLGPAAVPELAALVRSPSEQVRIGVVSALGSIADPAGIPALRRALLDEDDYLRGLAAQSLARIGTAEVLPVLFWAIGEGNVGAVRAVGRLRRREALEPLCCALRYPDPAVQEQAALALRSLAAPQSVAPLCAVLRAGDARTCVAAAEALERVSREHRLPELRAALPSLQRLAYREAGRNEAARQAYCAAMEAIESATAETRNLPRPVRSPAADPKTLPRPASASPPPPEVLPLPADGGPGADMWRDLKCGRWAFFYWKSPRRGGPPPARSVWAALLRLLQGSHR